MLDIIDTSLEIVTNQGNTIITEYEDLGDFSLKIPTEFNIMSEEAIGNKYPNGNAPSLVYTNLRLVKIMTDRTDSS